MRVSAEKTDAGYKDDFWRFSVTVDGRPAANCITADEQEGFAIILMADDRGMLLIDGNGAVRRETLFGSVKIERRPVS